MSDAVDKIVLIGASRFSEGLTVFTRGLYRWSDGSVQYVPAPGPSDPDDFAWFKYAMNQLGTEGGRLYIGPSSQAYFTVLGGAGLTQYVDVPCDNAHLDFDMNAVVRFKNGITSYALFRIFNQTRFKATGGTFEKIGTLGDIAAPQCFFYVKSQWTGSCDYPTFQGQHYRIASTNTALKNFACIRIHGLTDRNYWDPPFGDGSVPDRTWVVRSPRVLDCNVHFNSVQQVRAHDDPLLPYGWEQLDGSYNPIGSNAPIWGAGYGTFDPDSGLFTTDSYGGVFVETKTTRNLIFRGNVAVGDPVSDPTTVYGGGFLHVFDDEEGIYHGNSGYGGSLIANDGGVFTGGSFIRIGLYPGSGGGFEGSHYTLSDNYFEGINARYLVDAPAQHYCQIKDNSFGRSLVCAAAIHLSSGVGVNPNLMPPFGESFVGLGNPAAGWYKTAPVGGSVVWPVKASNAVMVTGNDFHNVQPGAPWTGYPFSSTAKDAWPGAHIWARDCGTLQIDGNRFLFAGAGTAVDPMYRLIFDTEDQDSVSNIMLGRNNVFPPGVTYRPIYVGSNVSFFSKRDEHLIVEDYGR